MKDNFYFGEDARNGLMAGVRKVTPLVATTLGSYGKNSLLESFAAPGSYPTNDGFSIINAIRLGNPIEEMGKGKLCEAINRANKNGGDGSSTTCVLCAEILEQGIKHLEEASPAELKKSLEDCLPIIEKSLKEQRKELVDKEGNIDFKLLEQTATISAESAEIGKMIADIYRVIGKDGIINWEASKTAFDSFETATAIKIDQATYASPYMGDMVGEYHDKRATMRNPYILLAQEKITSEKEIEKLFNELTQEGIKELVIFCNEMDAPVLKSLTQAQYPSSHGGVGFRFLVIKMPTVFNDLWWEDLSKATSGRVINRASGIRMKDVGISFLGRVEKITVTSEDTFLDGIRDLTKLPRKDGDNDTTYDYILSLKVEGTDEALARAARLNTKTARYYVGALSESTLRQRRDKVEDAINSAWAAMQNGIVAGGGIALMNASMALKGDSVGEKILRLVLIAPLATIAMNAGVKEVNLEGRKPTEGFDSRSKNIVDMFDEGIVDSYDIVYGAVKNAVGVASGILTCNSVVLLPRNENSVDEALKQIMQTPQ